MIQWTNHNVYKNIKFLNLHIWVKTDKKQPQLMQHSVMHHSSDGKQKLELVFVKHYAPNIYLSPNMAEFAVS